MSKSNSTKNNIYYINGSIAKKSKNNAFLMIYIAFFLLSIFAFGYHYKNTSQSDEAKFFQGLNTIILSTFITGILFILVTSIFGITNFKSKFFNFLIGDSGTYSLSRLQAVLWAIAIMSSQISIMLSLAFNRNNNCFSYYQPIFSESIIWLLGITLSSYVAVKGITVHKLTQNSNLLDRNVVTPKLRDILVGDNGLDFSKCQMLIWTLIALLVFETKCYYFNASLISESNVVIPKLFGQIYDEYGKTTLADPKLPYIPYLNWSFVVLMGLSQGIYVGKKLIPTFKLDDVKVSKQEELLVLRSHLKIKKDLLSKMLTVSIMDPNSAIDKMSYASIEHDIRKTEQEMNSITQDINQIDSYLQPNLAR